MSPKSLLASLETTYDVKLPKRYRTFMESKEYEKYPRASMSGYFSGPYNLDFTDELLTDVAELGMEAGIDDMDDVPWSDDYGRFVPLATLTHPEVDEPKMFLVMDVIEDGNPVLVFHQEGWKLFPVAKTFEGFLKDLPKARTDISKSFRPGENED